MLGLKFQCTALALQHAFVGSDPSAEVALRSKFEFQISECQIFDCPFTDF
jgi:hypothetical protein